MATLQERFAAMYGKPAQPASAVPESPLAGVTAAPSLSQQIAWQPHTRLVPPRTPRLPRVLQLSSNEPRVTRPGAS